MSRQSALVIIAIAGLCTGPAGAASAQSLGEPRRSSIEQSRAQKRSYDLIMKDIAATVAILRKNMDGDLVAAAADAAKLEGLFRETEDFWTEFKTKDAIDAARGGREVAVAVAVAAKNKDIQKAKEAASGLGKFCAACHNSHREQLPDKSYRIKP